jgi:hypothetical protein
MTSAVIDSPLPSLWLDWCEVTGTPPDRYADQTTLTQFTHHAKPSRAVLNGLGRLLRDRPSLPHHALAWPAGLHLQGTLRQISHVVARPETFWCDRLRLRRLAFVAVLIAPSQQSGLGLPRRTVRDLTPAQFAALRSDIDELVTPEPDGCAACATWEWLEVLGTNNGWSQASVRSLGHRYSRPVGPGHACARPDPSRDWHDCAVMVPHIDRWGWIDQSDIGLHPSSLSVLTGQLQRFGTQGISTGAVPSPRSDHDDDAHLPNRTVSPEEEQQILRRADEQNRRVQQLLRDYGG